MKFTTKVGQNGNTITADSIERLNGLNADFTPGASNTVSFWMYWTGGDAIIDWYQYGLQISNGQIGFFNGVGPRSTKPMQTPRRF